MALRSSGALARRVCRSSRTSTCSTEVAAAVDINLQQVGKFMVGSNHEIVSPEKLKGIDPELVVVMNPMLTTGAEINELGLDPELKAL